jgi:L-lactate dehydrogenase complex protein LldF
MKSTAHTFTHNVHKALNNRGLQAALNKTRRGFVEKRRAAIDALPEFEALRQAAIDIKNHSLAHLEQYLIQFEQQVQSSGGQVHWAETPAQATQIITDLCHSVSAKKITKGKTMVGEEVGLNEAIIDSGMQPVETDLGEYIIQLAKEPPSHIIAPAVHKSREQIAELFHEHHAPRGFTQHLETPEAIVNEARTILRNEYVTADVGITGANLLIAETGSTVLVTNEGNGDLTASLPRMHIVVASIEKVVPTLEDATVMLRLLARSATGQEITAYTTFFTGPKREADLDGPAQFHVVLVDNHRSEMLGNQYRDMLRCIHCGACLNHCPVYSAVGGHAYGWVYPGPMGAVLTPLMVGLNEGYHLPQASTFCGRCEEVCPLSIPLPSLLREHRHQIHERRIDSPQSRWALALWAYVAKRPRLYHWLTRYIMALLHRLAGKRQRFSKLPFANAWTKQRDFPAPQGRTFMSSINKVNRKDS